VSFNDSGDVAFIAYLDDARRGVYLANAASAAVPALSPLPLWVLAAGLVGLGGFGLRRRQNIS
jgi:MYXO-CTERM domain-containing protein